jgi:class 3 adenylate cyclase
VKLSCTNFPGIFKVETIGDCYVAVCGLPEPNKHHALKMAKFASICVDEMTIITKKLELSLGPGTADLALRSGLHSGPTIAGVLRGEKARFQLFGDTVSNYTTNCFLGQLH